MKKLLTGLTALTLLSAACGNNASVDLGENDFTPPTEVERGKANAGPFEQRLLSARSSDGIHWTRDNTIISEQGNACDMLIRDDGSIYLYYVAGNVLGESEVIAAAVSEDDGASWTFKKVTVSGVTGNHPPLGDPDIAMLEDGTYRLYFTSQLNDDKGPGIYYAEGTDGLNFDYQGLAFTYNEDDHVSWDSSAFYVDGHWAMLTFDNFGSKMIHASSDDGGESYTFVKVEDVTHNGEPYFLSNPFTLPDGSVRFWAFQLGSGKSVISFVTEDGLTWEDEGIEYLTYEDGANELEGYYIKDPVVVQLEDGSYFMVYVTRAP
jgi:hypothetical protein